MQTLDFESDLSRTIAKLEEANRRKDDLFAVLAHEMRAPLNAILTWTQVLRDNADLEMKHHALASIERSVKLQVRMIEDLLDASKISTGKLSVEMQLVDLATVVRNALDIVQPDASGKEIKIEFVPERVHMRGDPARLQQVVGNLLSNALKFTPKGGTVKVDIAATAGRAEIRISDTGEGISAEVLPHIFERYRQGDSVVKGRDGLGLGLTIAGHLVELHGGTVEAESSGKGLGATFRVVLPLNQ
jgi:signal transduction histidine kinase